MTITGLLSGQSNAIGGSTGGLFRINPLVTVWNNVTNIQDGTGLGTAWVAPDRNADPFFEGKNHQGVWVSHYLAKAMGEAQRMVTLARNGQKIEEWHDGVSVQGILQQIFDIVDEIGMSAPFDWFGWNQGSADSNSPSDLSSYRTKWDAMLAAMESEGLITSSTPIFVSETSVETSPEINEVLQDIADDDPRVGYAAIGRYPTRDGVHFTGPALVVAGWEGARALSSVPGAFSGLIDPAAVAFPAGTGYSRKAA